VSEEFCVVCGRTDVAVTEGECADCFAKRVPLVTAPEHTTVVLCPTCGARCVGQHWEPSVAGDRLTTDDLTPILAPHPEVGIRRVLWTESGGTPTLRELEGEVHLRFRGSDRVLGVRITVKVNHRACPNCSRKSGRFYTARIQLRGSENGPHESSADRRERLARIWDRVVPEARLSWRSALSWREALPEGWDFFLTDTTSARALARFLKQRLGADLKESATLWGRKDGHDVYRVTLRLRVPDSLR